MALNVNELVIDRVRFATTHDLETGQLLLRITQIEDASLNCTAEGDEVTDALGSIVTTIYRAKSATFSGNNALISLDLAAAQYGTEKIVADESATISDYTYEILTVKEGEETVSLAHTPTDPDEIKYIYSLVNKGIATEYTAGATASETEFVISADGTITVPTGFTGKLFVEYTYTTDSATMVVNKSTEFPTSSDLFIYVYFRDVCTDKLYSGKIIAPKAKLNPESIELGLSSDSNHPFEFTMETDYCAEEDEAELFSIIVSAA